MDGNGPTEVSIPRIGLARKKHMKKPQVALLWTFLSLLSSPKGQFLKGKLLEV